MTIYTWKGFYSIEPKLKFQRKKFVWDRFVDGWEGNQMLPTPPIEDTPIELLIPILKRSAIKFNLRPVTQTFLKL